jgi:hypothetical protein
MGSMVGQVVISSSVVKWFIREDQAGVPEWRVTEWRWFAQPKAGSRSGLVA